MIITRIIPGVGLGNQMFMYAAGLALSNRLNTELTIGAWDFETNHFTPKFERPYLLSSFPQITERMPSSRELMRICPSQIIINFICRKRVERGDIFRRLLRKIVTSFKPKNVYEYKGKEYNSDFTSIPDDTMIVGYWESEKYFAGISDLVRKKFTFPAECFSPELSAKITACNSVAIHVRRSDKVTHASFLPSGENYIRLAIEKISSLTDNPSFFVFSDDIDWCKRNLPLIHEAEYTFIEGQTPIQDMALMTLCSHVIIGASTFSWWGAWLNPNPWKIVISPSPEIWYTDGEGSADLLPPKWIALQ